VRNTVEAKGFKKSIREGTQLRIMDRAILDFSLTPGDVAESEHVAGESPLPDTVTASAGW
jgi:hypothetical protein